LGDQYIVGPPNLKVGDQSPPVPTVVAPMATMGSKKESERRWRLEGCSSGIQRRSSALADRLLLSRDWLCISHSVLMHCLLCRPITVIITMTTTQVQ